MTIGFPITLPPKSSAAIWAATTEPGPARSEYAPVMSVSTPTFTTSSEICAAAEPAAHRASATVRARFRLVRAMGPPLSLDLRRFSDAEEALERLSAALQPVVRDHVDDAAMLDEVVTVRERSDEAEILLDQDHGETLLLERPHHAPERLHDHRGEPFGDLVEQ